MPDWDLFDPQLRQLIAEGLSNSAIAKRLDFPRKTVVDRIHKLGLKVTQPSTPMTHESPVEVLPGQMSIEDADTPPEIPADAMTGFVPLPDGYAEVIQPMRAYTPAEEAALDTSLRRFGFLGTIVKDQYGRTIDGNQRERLASALAITCLYTVVQVKDDAEAVAIATSLNMVRRQYTREQREVIARDMRDQGWSYRLIAEALQVSVNTVQRDTATVLESTPGVVSPEPSPSVPTSTVLESTPAQVTPQPSPPPAAPTPPPPPPPPTPPPLQHTRDGRRHPAHRSATHGLHAGPKASYWYRQLAEGMTQWVKITGRFKDAGGLLIHAQHMPPHEREHLGLVLRVQAKNLSDMSAHMDTILQGLETPKES